MTIAHFVAVAFLFMVATLGAGLILILGGAYLYVTCRNAERERKC